MVREFLILALFPTVMVIAAVSDLLTMRISNRLCAALALGFFALALVIGMPLTDIGYHVLAGAAVLAVTFFFFSMGWIGGGDAKLAAATALWFGFANLLEYLTLAAIFGGALTLALLSFRFWPLPRVLAEQQWIARLHSMSAGIPYGIALAAAALLIYPYTPFMRALAG